MGGINLADEYINEVEKYGRWKDSGIMLQGKAVDNLLAIFMPTYNVVAKNVETTGYAYNAGLRSDDIITSIEFGGREYVADTYFLMFYDFERLLMNVSLNELTVKLNVSRVVSGSLETKEITINLVAGAFGELV
jgi:hypothetical protein